MGRRERISPADEAAAFIAANPEAAAELGIISAEQVIADAARAASEASRIANSGEGHNGELGQVTEL